MGKAKRQRVADARGPADYDSSFGSEIQPGIRHKQLVDLAEAKNDISSAGMQYASELKAGWLSFQTDLDQQKTP
jgi:hypothetical protein